MSSESQRWLPLEANPEVMNAYVRRLGVPESFELVDVLGTDKDLLAMVPQPVLAVLLLFPTSEKYEAFCKVMEEKMKEAPEQVSPDVYFMKQSISNACGTIALIHAIINNREKIKYDDGSFLGKFFEETKDKTPEERGTELEKNDEIRAFHSEHALLGQTEAPNAEEHVNLHFVALVNVGDKIYELDGRKSSPIPYSSTSEKTFLEDAVDVCKEYMERDPDELRFSIVALTGQ